MLTGRKAFAAAFTGAALFAAAPVWAATTVNVDLWDKGGDQIMPTGLGHGMHGDMSKATMGIKESAKSVHAGHVTFEVKNDSKDMVHEMIVAPLKSGDEVLPYMKGDDRVNEDEGAHLGEVSELDPGQTGELGIDLTPGDYILYCNIPDHYMAGMWTVLKVTK